MNTSIDQEKPTDYSKNKENEKLWNVNFAISHLSKNHTTTDTLEEKPKKNSLFIGDLSIFCEEQDLKNEFSSFGEIEDIKIMRSQETNRNLCYGFIRFTDPEAAQKAMEKMNGKILHGRPLLVNFASFKPKSGETRESAQGKGETSAVHVSFISYQTKKLVTEETLRNIFTQFGEVLDVSIKKSTIDEAINCQSGYGFVHFDVTPAGVEAAVKAVKELNDVQVEDVNYKCNVSHNLNKRLNNSNIRGNVSAASTEPNTNSSNEDRSREFERPILEEQLSFPRYDHTHFGTRRPCDIPPVGGRRPYPQGPPDINHTRVPDDNYYDTYYDDYAWESRDVREPYFRHKSDPYYRDPITRDRYPRDFYVGRDPRFDPRDPFYRGDPYWREREARASYTNGPPRGNPPAYAYDDYPYSYSRRGEYMTPREYLYSRDRYYEDYYDGPAYPPPPRAYPPVDTLEAYPRNRGPLVPPPVSRDFRDPRGLKTNVNRAVEENDGYTYDTEDEQQVCSFDFLQTPQSSEVQGTVGTKTLQPKNNIYPGQERDYCPGSKVTSQERGGDIRWSAGSGNHEVGNPLGYPSAVPNYAYSKKYPPRYDRGDPHDPESGAFSSRSSEFIPLNEGWLGVAAELKTFCFRILHMMNVDISSIFNRMECAADPTCAEGHQEEHFVWNMGKSVFENRGKREDRDNVGRIDPNIRRDRNAPNGNAPNYPLRDYREPVMVEEEEEPFDLEAPPEVEARFFRPVCHSVSELQPVRRP